MVDERRFYTYAYLRKDGTPYYIGKGQGSRAFKKGKNEIKPPIDKSRVIFLKQGLTEEEAFKHERYMIAVLGRKDLGTGNLRNLTDGGEGSSGWVATDETREKSREGGKKGGHITKLFLQKSVELTRMSDGEVFIFECANDAVRSLNLNQNTLSKVCHGKSYSVGGYLARYWSPDLKDWGEGLFHKVDEVRQKKKDIHKKTIKKSAMSRQKNVELTRISDGAVFVFDSLEGASRSLGLIASHLSKVCLGKRKSTKGFTARYIENSKG